MERKRNCSLPAVFVYTLLVSVVVVTLYEAFTARYTALPSSIRSTLLRTRLARQRSRRPHAGTLGARATSRGQSDEGPPLDRPSFLQRLQSRWVGGLHGDVTRDVKRTTGARREPQRKFSMRVSGGRRKGSVEEESQKSRLAYSSRSKDGTVRWNQREERGNNGETVSRDRSTPGVAGYTATSPVTPVNAGATTSFLSSTPGSSPSLKSARKATKPDRATWKTARIQTGTRPEHSTNATADQKPKGDPLKFTMPTAGELGVSGTDPHTLVNHLMKLNRCYLLRDFSGRLGNVLFELASAVCIAMKNNLTLVVRDAPSLKTLSHTGVVLPRKAFDQLKEKLPHQRHSNKLNCAFDEKLMTLRPNRAGSCSHLVGGYMQSWRYFEPCKQEVLRAIAFTDDIVTQARTIVNKLRAKLPGRTLVGVHVRMEDYLSPRALSNGKRIAPPEYYVKAMTYFRKRFHDVTFVVIAQDPNNFRANVTAAPDVTFLSRSDSPAVDMEVLARLDHVIMSVGTFGWWAGYKGRGTVVYYRDFFTPGTRYANQLMNNATSFMYPGWVPL